MFSNVRFWKDIRLNPQGSIHLGYVQHCTLETVVQVNGQPVPIKLGLPDIAVRLSRPRESDGKRVFRIEMPSTVKSIRNRQGVVEDRRIDHYHPADAQTRNVLTRALCSHPEILAAAQEAVAALKAGTLQVRSAQQADASSLASAGLASVGAQVNAGATPFDQPLEFACNS